MALRGTLKDFALPDIFQLIGMQRKTGLLTLKSERETVTVVFENGMVVMADSTVRRLDDLLGNVLVRQGKLRKQDLDEALNMQKTSMQRLGYILTSQGYIDTDALKAALAEQVQQIVFRVFRWKDGQYDFDTSSTVDYDRRQVTPVSTDHILMEGIRRVDEWPIIEKRIPSLRMVFRPLVSLSKVRQSQGAEEEGASLEAAFGSLGEEQKSQAKPPPQGVVLSETEYKVYALLDGKRPIVDLVEMTGMSDFDVSRTIFDLIERNLVEPVRHQRDETVQRKVVAVKATSSPVLGIVVLLLVLATAAVGLFFSYAEPFRIPAIADFYPAAQVSYGQVVTVVRMERVDSAIRSYYLSYGEYPASLDELVNVSPALLSPMDLRDGAGVPFLYDRAPQRVALAAMNEAGEPYLVFVHELLN
jgi:transcription initiation factor IIE alpha subunit